MKVADLIRELQNYSEDAEVHFAHGAGDYWRTTVAPSVRSVGYDRVEYSEYHRMDKLVDNEDDYGDDTREVVILA